MTELKTAERPAPMVLAGATLALALAAGPLAGAASAQDPAAVFDPAPAYYPDREVITVYGAANPLSVLDYPGQVSVVTREAIETFAPSAISDLLRDTPGVEFSGGPRRTGEAPSIRGLGGDNVLILIDGARQSFVSVHDGRFFLDPELIQTAEVVRGPASALYGSGASGGVLAFETVTADDLLAPGESFGARARAGYQDVNGETFGSVSAFGRSGGWDGLAHLSLRRSGDITLGSGAELPSDDDIRSGLLKAGYDFGGGLALDASWERFANSAIEPNNGQGVFGTGDAVLDRDVDKDITTDNLRAGLAYDPASPWVDVRAVLYRAVTSVEEFDPTTSRTALREIETVGASLRNSARFTLGPQVDSVVTLGADWHEDEQIGRDTSTPDQSRPGIPDGSASFLGAFAQLEATFERPLGLPGDAVVLPAIRFDAYESTSVLDPDANEDSEVSPKLGVSYGPTPWLRVFGNYAEGFRAPSINELYLSGLHFSVPHPTLFNPALGRFVFVNNNFVPNPDLAPEHSETVEFGVALDFADVLTSGDRLTGKVSRYENAVDGLINLAIDFTFAPTCFAPPSFFPCNAGTTTTRNIGAAELEGVEAEFAYESDRITGRLTYTTVDGVDTATGAKVGALTPDRLALDLAYALPAWDARVGARLQVAGDFERLAPDSTGSLTFLDKRDGYTVADLYGTWRPSFAPAVRLDASIENLFDEDYERVFAGVSEPGRNVKIAATYQFGR